MKNLKGYLVVLLGVLFLGAGIAVHADGLPDKDKVELAHALKAKGQYKEASDVHPNELCKAVYLWNAACQLVGDRDTNGRWMYNPSKVTPEVRNQAMGYLIAAHGYIAASDGKSCTGVDAKVLDEMIDNVKACLDGKCK